MNIIAQDEIQCKKIAIRYIKELIENVRNLNKLEKFESLAKALQDINFHTSDLNFIDYTKKFSNGMTLLEYCYQQKYYKALNFAYVTQLQYQYTNI